MRLGDGLSQSLWFLDKRIAGSGNEIGVKTKNKKLIAGQKYKKTNREVKKGKREIIDVIAYEAEKAVKMNDIKSAVRVKYPPKVNQLRIRMAQP